MLTGPPVTYDPWGTQYPAIATQLSNATGNANLGAYGTAGKITEHDTTNPTILMGARALSPTEGRFLGVDPVDGGVST